MKIVLSGIEKVFDCEQGKVWSVVIESPNMLYEVVSDIEKQMEGMEGKSVLSEDNKVLRIDKFAEQITQFVPFDMNKKTLLNKIMSEMQRLAADESHLMQTNELLSKWEKFCINLEFELPVNIEFAKINTESLLKASGIMIADDYDSLAEKILDYIQLVENFECKKLFILVNLRSFINDEDMQLFINTIIERQYQVILLENAERKLLDNENRYLVDADMCEICYSDK